MKSAVLPTLETKKPHLGFIPVRSKSETYLLFGNHFAVHNINGNFAARQQRPR